MENKTVKELKEIAKERKIKYYYKLRKEDLVRALQPIVQRPVPALRLIPATRPVAAPRSIAQSPIVQRPVPAPRPVPATRPVAAPRPIRSILDEPIPSSASSPVLTPGIFSRFTTAAKSVASYVANTLNNLLERIDPYVPEPIKKKVRQEMELKKE